MARLAEPRGEKAMKIGDWNDVQFSVQGNHIVTFVNGVKALDYTDPGAEVLRRRDRAAAARRRTGQDALQGPLRPRAGMRESMY